LRTSAPLPLTRPTRQDNRKPASGEYTTKARWISLGTYDRH
jgi:hypothetical protein